MGVIECPTTFIHVVRPHYFIMTGSVCGAILMNYFEQWQISVGNDRWFFRNQEDMAKDLFGMFTVRQIRGEIDELVSNGLVLWRNNPTIAQIKTRQYRLNIPMIQEIANGIYEGEGKQYIIGAKDNFEGAESVPSIDTNGTLKVQKVYLQGAESVPSNNRTKEQKQKKTHGTESPTDNAHSRGVVVSSPSGEVEELLLKRGLKPQTAKEFTGLPMSELEKAIAESERMANPVGFLVKALRGRWYAKPSTPDDVRDALGNFYKYSLGKGLGWFDSSLDGRRGEVLALIKEKAIEMGQNPQTVIEYFGLRED